MLEGLFIKKANFNRIKSILDSEGFVYKSEDIDNLLKGNQKGVRYGNAVLIRNEEGGPQRRFLKIVIDGTYRTFKLFKRQVEVTRALANDSNYKFPKLRVEKVSFKLPLPYAIFETREDGEGFGFMHDRSEYYDSLTKAEVLNLVRVIYGFHKSGLSLDEKLFKYTQKIDSSSRRYEKELKKDLSRKIVHKNIGGEIQKGTVEALLEQYTGIKDINNKILSSFKENWANISSKRSNNKYLVHADMALDNIYKHIDGNFEPLDFEWVGVTDNPAVSIIFDYGNLRARAWSSAKFQSMLDEAMLEIGILEYADQSFVKSSLNLGILKYSLMMSRFHLDYQNTVKKDRRTEEDYFNMFPKTISSLSKLLT